MTDLATLFIGIDAGTSVIKAVAFDAAGHQIDSASVKNKYTIGVDGSARQSMEQIWLDCAQALLDLGEKIDRLASRTAGIAVTAQGDGTWLAGKNNEPVTDAWMWLDASAAPTVQRLLASPLERGRFEATGTGLNTCQQGSQMAHMLATAPELLEQADVVLHCKDWLYLGLTGIRATDPSEASFTFGNFRDRHYDDLVLDALGLADQRHLLPPILDGSHETHGLTEDAARQTGLLEGTPVSLGYVDMVMTALGAGVHTGDEAACSVIGSTGVHMRSVCSDEVYLNEDGTGYVMVLPVADQVTQMQSNMAATLNIDWLLHLAGDMIAETGEAPDKTDLVSRIDGWIDEGRAGSLLYHPYISDSGERGPFTNAHARASFIGLRSSHRFPDLMRSVVEGLALAARDCYAAMGAMPGEVRLTGGAARSRAIRSIFSAAIGAPVCTTSRQESGAAGAAMMAAVAHGAYRDMDACIAQWVTPLLSPPEPQDPDLAQTYDRLYAAYATARQALAPIWEQLNDTETIS